MLRWTPSHGVRRRGRHSHTAHTHTRGWAGQGGWGGGVWRGGEKNGGDLVRGREEKGLSTDWDEDAEEVEVD